MRPDKTKMSEFGAERGSLQGHARRRVASTLKDPQLLESFQQSSFIGKGGVVSCCKFLGVRSFVLKVRSWSGHNVAGSLHQKQMLFSVLTKKGKVLRLNFCPPRPRLRGGVPGPAGFSAREHWSSTQSVFFYECPGPAEEAELSRWRTQGRVPRACPAVITEGARRPAPSQSGFSFKPERIICVGSVGIRVVANAYQVSAQLTAVALL